MNLIDTIKTFETFKLKNYIHVIMHSVRYVESRHRYSNYGISYYFLQFDEMDSYHK